MQQLPASALCFGNVAFFWYAHYVWSRRYGLEDAQSTFLSLVLIFLVLVFVFPLKAIYSGAFLFIPGIDADSTFIFSSVEDFGVMLVIFGIAFSSLSTIITLLNWHALSVAGKIELSSMERFDTITTIQNWLATALIPLGSAVIALLTSGMWQVAAAFFYGIFGLVMPILSSRRKRLRRVLFPEA